MSGYHYIRAFLSYRKNAVSKHGVHSPFVFDLVTKIFPRNRKEDISENIAEEWRTECRVNNHIINVTDLGTGTSGPRKIADIAARAAKSPKEGFLLHRIVKRFQPKKMLELGTSLGITTLHEASATNFEKFITLEGCPEVAALAKSAFQKYKLPVPPGYGEPGPGTSLSGPQLNAFELRYLITCVRPKEFWPTLKEVETWHQDVRTRVQDWCRIEHAHAHPIQGMTLPERGPLPNVLAALEFPHPKKPKKGARPLTSGKRRGKGVEA